MPGGKKQKGKAKPTEKPSLLAEEEMMETNGESSGEDQAKTDTASKPAAMASGGTNVAVEDLADLENDKKILPRHPKRAKRDAAREKVQKDPLISQQLKTPPAQVEPSSESVADSEKEELEEVERAQVTTRARGGGKKAKKMKPKDKGEETHKFEAEVTEDDSRGGEKKVQASSKRGGRKKQKETASPLEETKMVEEGQEKGKSVQQSRTATVRPNKKDQLATKETDVLSQEISTTKMVPRKGSKRGSQQSREEKGSSMAVTTDEVTSTVEQGAEASPPRQYWLMKSEPECRVVKGVDISFGIEDLLEDEQQTTCWDGIRNYQARNIMRDQMKVGDLAFFYHSNCKQPGIAGLIEIIREGYVDHTQFTVGDPHYDPKSTPDTPKWFMVDVKLVREMRRFIPLSELKKYSRSGGALTNMTLFTSGRLSVQPVQPDEFQFILNLEEKED